MFYKFSAAFALVCTSVFAQAQSGVPAYQPSPVTVPDSASYLTRDGKVQIVGNDGWEEMMTKFDEFFLKTHPGFKRQFHTVMKGSSVAIPALQTGVSALSPMARAMWEDDRFSFHRLHGYDPLDIHIGYAAFGPRAGKKSPPWIYINAKNPLAGLTVEQIRQIFTDGAKGGTITRWSQLGVKGPWANRTIHVYGLDQGSGGTLAFRAQFLEDRTFTRSYEALPKAADLGQAIADDPYGIALLGFFDATANPNIKPLPVSEGRDAAFLLPTYENVAAERTPFPAYLHIYVNREPGKPMDPFVKEYVKMLLSEQGQAIIATQKDTDEGYVPLKPDKIADELRKLD
ncbi:PstS family phosphate ABC transporter substrate-binding protein [Terriglobus saanensis]|uniref:Phosphate binding protein n=1 Tax=Terriglobus saanensis (strain ATCC BAA-1853 / DSM 23119 / SP1PR4) TaxID=401053 RepID=E8UX58_TERSS|nr:substrate-binding domain-containing protein [Terriglobus saanensis]ADV83021.1 phosphate binding protein [Terriglobus saanensis SP1PR4]